MRGGKRSDEVATLDPGVAGGAIAELVSAPALGVSPQPGCAAPGGSLRVALDVVSQDVVPAEAETEIGQIKKRDTEEQIIGFVREADAGLPVKELCRKHGFSEPRVGSASSRPRSTVVRVASPSEAVGKVSYSSGIGRPRGVT